MTPEQKQRLADTLAKLVEHLEGAVVASREVLAILQEAETR